MHQPVVATPNQAPARIHVYSCIYDEYKGFILYLYLQVTTDFVLTIIRTTCHFLVADVLSAGTCPSQDFRSETYFQKLCDSINGYNILTVDANSRGTARRIILKLEVHVELHVSGSAPPAAQGTLGRLSVPSTSL